MNTDYQIFQSFNNLVNHSVIFDAIVKFVAVDLWLIFSVAVLVWWFVTRDTLRVRHRIVMTILSAAAGRLVVGEIIKRLVHRPRPFTAHQVQQIITKDAEPSFPSGHTTYMVAAGMSLYFYNKKLGIGVMVLGLIIGLARVIAGVHYPTDIVGGLAIGAATGWAVEKLFSKKLQPLSQWCSRFTDKIFRINRAS